MSFGETRTQVQPRVGAKRTQFLKLTSGVNVTIRVLGKERLDFTHYINGASILCLGEECPVCSNNKRLYMQYPTTFRNDPSYSPKAKRYSVNVLDKTMVKRCTCGLEYTDLRTTNCTCGKIITAPATPSNTVKVMSKGPTLFDLLFAINDAVQDTTGEPVGIDNFDITLVVSGAGKTTQVTPIAHPERTEPTPEGLELYELEKIAIRLDPGEIMELQRGVSLRDLFASRKASAPTDTTVVAPEVAQSVRDEVDSLFKSAVLS